MNQLEFKLFGIKCLLVITSYLYEETLSIKKCVRVKL